MALCLKCFFCFGVCLSVVLPGILSNEIDAVYTFLSRRIDDVLIKTELLKVKVDSIDTRVKNVEEKLQGLQTTTTNPIDLRTEDHRRELETELKDSLEMQALAVEKMLSKEKLHLRASMENFTIVFAGLKSEILTQMSVFNASFKEKITNIGTEFDNLKSEIRLEMIVYNKTLSKDISAMVSNIKNMEKQVIADVKKEKSENLQSISDLQADVHSLSTNISTFTSVLSNRILSESSALSSNISSLSSSLSFQMSSHSNRIHLLEERMDGIDDCNSNPCMNNATCVDGINSYSCRCLPGYNGTNCQIDIDDCANVTCQNGATCNDRVNGYFCRCTDNWVGTHCDQRSHYGTEFYIGLYPLYVGGNDILVDIASQQDGTAVLSVPFLNLHRNVTITTGATTLKVDKSITKRGTFIENRGIRIQTDVPVAIFVTMNNSSYMDTYLALPVTALGTSYKVASYHPVFDGYPAFYSVFGMRENTNVTTHIKKQSASFTSEPFSVGQHDDTRDLTGTFIQSDNIIAVISGTAVSCIPRKIAFYDYIVEQMVPTRHWVKHFIVPPVFPKQGFVLKILTIHNETVCIKNTTNTICNFSSILSDAEMLMETDPVVVTSAAPISVVQYGVGYWYDWYDDVGGGPFMTVIPGISNYLNEYNFVVPSVYINVTNYLSVIVPSSQAQELYLDGSSLSVIKQYNVPDPFSNYTVIITNITVGYHRLRHKDSNVMFGATLYGLEMFTSYGFPVGFSFTNG